jgi:four helix bundle protein
MKKGIYEIGRSNLRCASLKMFSVIPKSTQAQVLGKQVLRSGTSVGANYREAYRGRSKAEFIAKCGDSLRELEETAYWLELLVDGRSSRQKSSQPSGRNVTSCYPHSFTLITRTPPCWRQLP